MGIVPGIAASEARYAARSGTVHFVDYCEEDYTDSARQWLDVCSEYTSVIEPVQPHCAYLDLTALPAPHEVAEPMTADIYHAIRLCPKIGVASSKLIARIAGRALQPGQDAVFLSAQPIESLWPVALEHRKRRRFLGYRTIGEVAALPSSLLKKQFGEQGLTILRWAMGIDPSQVRALYPPEKISAKFYFPQSARNDAEIEVALKYLAEDLCGTLGSRDAQTRKIALGVAFETREEYAERVFNQPMRSVGALLTGIRLTLRQVSLKHEVAALHVQIVQEPASDTQYAMEVDKSSSDASPAVDRLKETFGTEAIYAANEVVTPRRRLLLRAYEGEV
jgi:nucleotidyltransferase/DNA polymerase involved in DNA repair